MATEPPTRFHTVFAISDVFQSNIGILMGTKRRKTPCPHCHSWWAKGRFRRAKLYLDQTDHIFFFTWRFPWRIRMYGRLMLTWMGYIDGKWQTIYTIHGFYGIWKSLIFVVSHPQCLIVKTHVEVALVGWHFSTQPMLVVSLCEFIMFIMFVNGHSPKQSALHYPFRGISPLKHHIIWSCRTEVVTTYTGILSYPWRIHVWYIYANIWGILMVNVTIYTIHGFYGIYWYAVKYIIKYHHSLSKTGITVLPPTAVRLGTDGFWVHLSQ